MSKYFWGIDIGKSALKAVKVEKQKGRLEVVDLELIEFEIKDADVDRDEQVKDALARLQQRRKFGDCSVFFSIPGQGTFNRIVSLPPVENKQIKDMVRWEAQQQIPFPIDDVIWDYQQIDNEGDKFAEVQVNLFAVKKDTINNHLAQLQASGFKVDGIQIAPLALFNFMVYDQQPAEAIVVIDMGAGSSDLVVINGSRIWIRNLTIAGDEITRKIQEKFQIPFSEAEKLKLKAAKSKHTNKIFQVMKPVLKDLVNEIHRSIGYYKSQNADVRFTQVLLLGGATKLVGFKRFFRDNLPDYTIELIKGLNKISVSNRANVNLLQQNLASFAVAIGLAVQAAGEAKNKVSLIPQEIKAADDLRKKQKWYMLAVVLLGVVVGLKFAASTQLAADLKGQKTAAETDTKNVKDRLAKFDTATDWGPLSTDAASIAKIEPCREQWAEIVGAVYGLIPACNNRIGAPPAELAKDSDMLWLYDLGLKSEVEVVSYKPPGPNQPAKPPQVRRRIAGYVGVCTVAREKSQVVENTKDIDTRFVGPLKKKLEDLIVKFAALEKAGDAAAAKTLADALVAKLRVVPEDAYGWVPIRDHTMLTRRRYPNLIGPGISTTDAGPFFCRAIEIDYPLNVVEEP